jgi:hypothetical protein
MGDVITDKESAKKDIYGALFGLAILLATYVVLNTINPQLTNLNILESAQPSPPPPPGAEVSGIDPSWATGEMDGTGAATSGTTRDPNAINCPQGQLKFRYTNGTLGCGTGHGSGFNVTGAQAAAAAEDCRSVEGTFQVRSIVGSGPQYVCSW